jgi:mono/diheme cytochrome c family protein
MITARHLEEPRHRRRSGRRPAADHDPAAGSGALRSSARGDCKVYRPSRLGMSVLLALSLTSIGLGCRQAQEPSPVNAVQEAFREGELTARESHGRRVFAERCATCHGAKGRGDGQNAYNLEPPPPDFQDSLSELSPEDRRRVIEGGTAALGRSPLCPAWGRSLDGSEVEALLAYLAVMERPTGEEEPGPGRRRWRRPR